MIPFQVVEGQVADIFADMAELCKNPAVRALIALAIQKDTTKNGKNVGT